MSPTREPPRGYRFTTRGRIKLPSKVNEAEGCAGKVRVTVRRTEQSKPLSSRLVKVGNSCRFTSELRFDDRSRLGEGPGALRLIERFQGNSRLVPRQVTLTARYG